MLHYLSDEIIDENNFIEFWTNRIIKIVTLMPINLNTHSYKILGPIGIGGEKYNYCFTKCMNCDIRISFARHTYWQSNTNNRNILSCNDYIIKNIIE